MTELEGVIDRIKKDIRVLEDRNFTLEKDNIELSLQIKDFHRDLHACKDAHA